MLLWGGVQCPVTETLNDTVMFSGEGARVEWDDKVCPVVA